jgi:hypothetical protein
MGSIEERKHKSCTTYRINLRPKGRLGFSLTFEEYESAAKWMEENEKKFLKDPEYYFDWKENLYYSMIKKGIQVYQGIIKPKIRQKLK